MEPMKAVCPNCGAPVTTQICPYCHAKTNIDAYYNYDHPVFSCKNAKITFMNTWLPFIFGFISTGALFSFSIISGNNQNNIQRTNSSTDVIKLMFLMVAIPALIIFFVNVFKYLLVKIKGKEIEASVCGSENGIHPSDKEYKLLINKDGKKGYILYRIEHAGEMYKNNSSIKLLNYKDLYLIKKDKNEYF